MTASATISGSDMPSGMAVGTPRGKVGMSTALPDQRLPFAHRPGLPLEQAAILAVGAGEQALVGPVLDDAALVEDEDAIERTNGRQAVGDDDRRPADHQPLDRLLDERLRFRIQA